MIAPPCRKHALHPNPQPCTRILRKHKLLSGCRQLHIGLLIACAPFSSPFTVASPFFGVFCWETAVVVAPAVAAVAAAAAAALACCCASFSRNACCRVWTTSGITASIRDRDSIGLPSNTVPSCRENEHKGNPRVRIFRQQRITK